MTQIQHARSGFWMPDNTGAAPAIKEAYHLKDYGGLPVLVPFEGEVVMDCGAHIGCFSKRALEEGAKRIVCYEPMAENADSLRLNLDPEKTEIVNAALALEVGTADFHFRSDRLISGSMVHKGVNHTRWNYETMTVPTVDFWEELDRVRPSIVKMDIEGTEWDILDRPFPDYVKAFFYEIHLSKRSGRTKEVALEFAESKLPGSTHLFQQDTIVFKKLLNITGLVAR